MHQRMIFVMDVAARMPRKQLSLIVVKIILTQCKNSHHSLQYQCSANIKLSGHIFGAGCLSV